MPVFIGGKSLGGRIASYLAKDRDDLGLIAVTYPFHRMGKPETMDIEHFK